MCVRFYVESKLLFEWAADQRAWVPSRELIEREGDRFPGSESAVLRIANERRELVLADWGLIPRWTSDIRFGVNHAINARAEGNDRSPGIEFTPAFRDAFRLRRCVVPVSGFYEQSEGFWQRFTLADEPVFGIAGLWEPPHLTRFPTFTLITTVPNSAVEPHQDRMPVILSPSDYETWLSPMTRPVVLKELLRPILAERVLVEQGEPTRKASAPSDQLSFEELF